MGKARGNVRRDWLKPYRFPLGFRDGATSYQRSPFLGEVAQGRHISMVSHARNDGGGARNRAGARCGRGKNGARCRRGEGGVRRKNVRRAAEASATREARGEARRRPRVAEEGPPPVVIRGKQPRPVPHIQNAPLLPPSMDELPDLGRAAVDVRPAALGREGYK